MEIKNVSKLQGFASENSRKFQKYYTRLTLASTIIPIFIILLNLLLSINATNTTAENANFLRSMISLLSAVLFIASIFLILFIHYAKIEKKWFLYRALAESLKTTAWIELFRADDSTFEDNFISKSKEIKDTITNNNKHLKNISYDYENLKPSKELIELSKENSDKKLQIYSSSRLQQQIKYYSDASISNNSNNSTTTYSIVVCYAIALFCVILKIFFQIEYSFEALLASIGAAILSWRNLRDYASLGESYTQTASTLEGIKIDLEKNYTKLISNPDELYKFIEGSENAISNEHKIWIARRTGKIL